ncbi:hypothetical protein O1L60_30970 [Streptomyces diastatochromogenes]|nr:hypothetical protein [Streptomyces diastatochromogenes]
MAHTVLAASATALVPEELTATVGDLVDRALLQDPADVLLTPANGPADIGFLEGAAGVALALHAVLAGPERTLSWDSSLLTD